MEKFILKVKSHRCLWDTNSVYFRDVTRKNAAWDAVAHACGIRDIIEAKALWKKLRDSHREAMRRRKNSKVLAQWKYEEIMEFLLPQNADNHHDDEASTAEDDDNKIIIENETTESRRVPMYVEVLKKENILDEVADKEKRRNENERRKTEVRNYTDKNRSANDEALKDLFSGLYQKTMQLPKHLQIRVQREVFDAVLRAEEEALSYEYPGSSGCERNLVMEAGPSNVEIKKENLDEDTMVII